MADLGRSTTCRVSGYNRGRLHQSRLITGEKRQLVADFNGAMPLARNITSARWRCDVAYVLAMSNPSIAADKRSTQIDIVAQWLGSTMMLCEATLDNGEIYTQMFVVDVSGNPYFLPSSTTPGLLDLTVTA